MKYIVVLFIFFTTSIRAQTNLHDAVDDVSEIIVHDVFSAPAASRIYAYCTIAAYETMQHGDDNYNSFFGKINALPEITFTENKKDIDFEAAGILACYFTAQYFVFSENLIQGKIDLFMSAYTKKYPEKSLNASILFAKKTTALIVEWSASDNYISSRPLPRYTLMEGASAWRPTGPDYADAIEPYWGTLRTFVINQEVTNNIAAPPVFSTDTNSQFYKEAYQVYATGNTLTTEQKNIAEFWDDNPFAVTYVGHMQYAKKKISPAGHWLDIAGTVMQQQQVSSIKSAYVYALTAITIADAFIACWKVKYNTHLLRPETYIKTYIDPNWTPYLVTPAFPEYSSGHSTISAASSIILTYCIGDNLGFIDDVESAYGLAPRRYNSFAEAANEASISRLYGGIHFFSALQSGVNHGNEIGQFILNKMLSN